MAHILDLTKPYLAYYSIPAAFVVPAIAGIYKTNVAGKHYDIAMPRRTVANLEKDTSIPKQTVLRAQRAEAAAANAWESLGLYAAGMVAAAGAGVPVETLNVLGASYVASRAAFTVVYIFLQDNRQLAPLRSLCWMVGIGITFTLWIKAGNLAAAGL